VIFKVPLTTNDPVGEMAFCAMVCMVQPVSRVPPLIVMKPEHPVFHIPDVPVNVRLLGRTVFNPPVAIVTVPPLQFRVDPLVMAADDELNGPLGVDPH
jgi:hypothetical protein